MVVPERKFVQVQRQIVLAHLVVTAHNSALEQAPKAFNRVRMNRTDNVLILAVIDRLMDETVRAEMTVSGAFIGRHKRDFLRDGFSNETVKRIEPSFLDHLADHVSLPADCADHHRLADSVAALTSTLR